MLATCSRLLANDSSENQTTTWKLRVNTNHKTLAPTQARRCEQLAQSCYFVVHLLGIEPWTFRSRVQCFNRRATKPLWFEEFSVWQGFWTLLWSSVNSTFYITIMIWQSIKCFFIQENLQIICQIIKRLKLWCLSWVKCNFLRKAHKGNIIVCTKWYLLLECSF